MRVAEICDTCATYINASCIIYNGVYLPVLDVSPLDGLDDILVSINAAYAAQTGNGEPTTQIPLYIGQHYIDTSTSGLWVGLATTGINWGFLGVVATTSTTTTIAPTTTTTTTV